QESGQSHFLRRTGTHFAGKMLYQMNAHAATGTRLFSRRSVAAPGDRRAVTAERAHACRRATLTPQPHAAAPEAAVMPMAPEAVMMTVVKPGTGGKARAQDECDRKDNRAGQHMRSPGLS